MILYEWVRTIYNIVRYIPGTGTKYSISQLECILIFIIVYIINVLSAFIRRPFLYITVVQQHAGLYDTIVASPLSTPPSLIGNKTMYYTWHFISWCAPQPSDFCPPQTNRVLHFLRALLE